MWVWVAGDVKTKIIPVLKVVAHHQEMAFMVVHELKGGLAASSLPVFRNSLLKLPIPLVILLLNGLK